MVEDLQKKIDIRNERVLRERKALEYSNQVSYRRETKDRREIVFLLIIALAFLLYIGIQKGIGRETETIIPATEPNTYVMDGYYKGNTTETEDGNVWEYTRESSDRLAEGSKCKVLFNNNGTPNNVYDDVIISIYALEG